MADNVLDVKDRAEFRAWLQANHATATECWVVLKRGKPTDEKVFYYLDAVEEALCFGWIDSTLGLVNGIRMQRFTPRQRNGNWTELNKERVRRLERLGLMTAAGRSALPRDMDSDFCLDAELKTAMIETGAYENFIKMPPLYQRVRAYNLLFTKTKLPREFEKAWKHFVEKTSKGEMYGEWNDYGRLL